VSGRNTQRWDGEYEFGSPWGDEVDEDADFAGPDDEDTATDVRPCPACGAEVYAESDHCPNCGELISDVPLRSQQQPNWRIVLIVLLIIGLLLGAGLGGLW
jgi:hypothetical protein